ncbi:MAG: helix-turn-helix domain containing protein [bacterium]
MTGKKALDLKADSLNRKGALNRNPERVTDKNFQEDEFFDPRDMVQVKYEMLRQVSKEQKSVTQASASFGMSRFSFYQAQSILEREGLPGLVPKKPGPRGRHKLNSEVMTFIKDKLKGNPSLKVQEILNLVKNRFALIVHQRTVERALVDAKKKRH